MWRLFLDIVIKYSIYKIMVWCIYETMWCFHDFQNASHSSYDSIWYKEMLKNLSNYWVLCTVFLKHKIWEADTFWYLCLPGCWPGRHSRWCFIASCFPFFISLQYFHCLLWFAFLNTVFIFFLFSSYSSTFSVLLLSTAGWFCMVDALAIVCRLFTVWF